MFILYIYIYLCAFITITQLWIVLFYINKNDKYLKQKRKTEAKSKAFHIPFIVQVQLVINFTSQMHHFSRKKTI